MSIYRTCKNCGSVFKIYNYKLKTGRGLYCSINCYHTYKKLHGLTVNQKKKISIATKKAVNNPIVRERFLSSYTSNNRKQRSNSAKKQMFNLKNDSIKYKKWIKSISDSKKQLWKSLSNTEKEKRIKKLINRGVKTHLYLLKTDKKYKNNFINKFKGKNNPFYGKHHPKKLMDIIRKKQSKTLSKLISEGKINSFKNKFKRGKYISKITHNTEYYDSSYELKRMKQLDKLKLHWTKKHGIRIPYKDENNIKRNYVPDILVENKVLEEIKPKSLINTKINHNCYKTRAAIKYCKNHSLIYKIITEKELEL